MKNLKSKLDRLFWDFEETATCFDKINLVCSFAKHIDNMDDSELAEKLEINADDPDFDIEILNARQAVSNGCDKWLAA
jgi:hypothetical protein